MISKVGMLYLIPIRICDGDFESPNNSYLEIIKKCKVFIVEEPKTARRFISSLKLGINIEEIIFHRISDEFVKDECKDVLKQILNGDNIGMMSESGCPAVADPGSNIVLQCHKMGIKVKPIVGPSSILLSLMASGLSGQSFVFHGYLPAKTELRQEKIKKIEKESLQKDQTQIFIETPYRNNAMLVDLLLFCNPTTLLSVSSDLMSENEDIFTGTIQEWKNSKKSVDKVPCVFLIHQKR